MNHEQPSTLANHLCVKVKSNARKGQGSAFGWSSTNWSGYCVTGRKGSFTRISGEWFVPYVKPSYHATYSSAWIGIDGFKNSSLIQTGTGHESVKGITRYYAWWEILPDTETVIPLQVNPGDHMKAIITKINHCKWMIILRNISQNWIFRTLQRYTGPRTSGEWIVEAPEVDGLIAKLARFTPTAFHRCQINGRNPMLALSMGGVMIQNTTAVAVPSCPNPQGDSFIVKRRCLNTRSTM